MPTNATTQRYAVIGHPVAHSLSPVMHNANFKACGDDAIYEREDIPPADLERFILENPKHYRGLSVTIPHKEALFDLLTRKNFPIDPVAQTAKSVNTIKYVNGTPHGWSTDGEGFIRSFHEAFDSAFEKDCMKDQTITILGNGGSARAVAEAAVRDGAAKVIFAARDVRKAEALAEEFNSIHPGRFAGRALGMDVGAFSGNIIVNATSLGLKPDDPPVVPAYVFDFIDRVMDLIYAKDDTPFIRAAKTRTEHAVDGLGMLLHQGAVQYEIWTGRPANIEAMRAALHQAVGRKS